MHRWLPGCLALACIAVLLAGHSLAQDPSGKSDDKKGKEDNKEPAKEKPGLDKLKVPPGGIVVLVDEIKEALKLVPKAVLMTIEEYQDLKDRIARLEKELKADKKTPHACKMSGKLDGDFVSLHVEFAFTTDVPRSSVLLGLQGAYLTDEGDLDRAIPLLDFGDDGYFVRVDKEGTHQLALNLKLPVGLKRTAGPGGVAERGFDLGLPGAAVTTLTLELPSGIKEIRWNENIEKPRAQSRWQLALGKIKNVNVSWKEPLSLPGQGPLLTADSQAFLKIDETHATLTADMTLEDLRGQTTEWQLLLPSSARVEVKAPAGVSFDLTPPDAKTPHYLLKLKDPSAERLLVSLQLRLARPFANSKVPIGPLAVIGAYRQQGTITIQATPEALRGQRLVFHRHGETYQRDLAKSVAADAVAAFQFWSVGGKAVKGPANVPLEVEMKTDKGRVEMTSAHTLAIRSGADAWIVEATSRFHIKAPPSGLESFDIQLPRPHFLEAAFLGGNVAGAFPISLPWGAFGTKLEGAIAFAQPLDFFCDDDSGFELGVPDLNRKVRAKMVRGANREFDLVLTGKYRIAAADWRARLVLPRVVDAADRGGTVTIRAADGLDLLFGPTGAESPVADHQPVKTSFDQAPAYVSLAWGPRNPEARIATIADLTVRENEVRVDQHVSYVVDSAQSPLALNQIRLRVPSAVRGLTVASGGRLIAHEAGQASAVVAPTIDAAGKVELHLKYDFALPRRSDAEAPLSDPPEVDVPLVWIEGIARQDCKLRVWTEPGTFPILPARRAQEAWKSRGAEIAPDRDSLPALVLETAAADQPLTLTFQDSPRSKLASVIGERALIQVAVDDDGSHAYRARYFLRKIHGRHIDIELPLPVSSCLQRVLLDQKKSPWTPIESNNKRMRIPVEPGLYDQPVVLEVSYKLPASFSTGKRFFKSTLFAPKLGDDFVVGRTRWQVSLPDNWVAAPTGSGIHADWRWAMQGWLAGPEPSASASELESWFSGRASAENDWPVSLAFSSGSHESVGVLHLPRQVWLVCCSGLLVVIGLSLYLAPLSRVLLWCSAGTFALGGAVLIAWWWPNLAPTIAMGCEPGLLVLAMLFASHWVLRESYRRRMAFIPGFSRVKPDSALVGAGENRPREGSTMNAPKSASGSFLKNSGS